LDAAAMPLTIAPSIFGLTQKSPAIASLLFFSQRHFSSLAMLVAGNALPLQEHQVKEILSNIEWLHVLK
jgi:hypothetical protein